MLKTKSTITCDAPACGAEYWIEWKSTSALTPAPAFDTIDAARAAGWDIIGTSRHLCPIHNPIHRKERKGPQTTDRSKKRAETYQGVANAMAAQWGQPQEKRSITQ